MLDEIANKFIFPAPFATYGSRSYESHLCWIPWNSVISPERCGTKPAGIGIPCLWFPAPKAAIVILFFHSNAEDLGMSFNTMKNMRDQFKVNVLAVEYPGYGMLRGVKATEGGIYEAALTAFRYLVDKIGVPYSQIILFGRSLGSGAAVHLAAQYPVGGLILVAPISSVRGAVQSVFGPVLARSFTERFPNHQIMANVSCSTLFIHGEADNLIPMEHSLLLFKKCRARKLLITPPKMEHNSNLFKDTAFLAEPAIHFFGFPGYYTTVPPRLPDELFESPDKKSQSVSRFECESGGRAWFCHCLPKKEQHHLDVTLCRTEEGMEDDNTTCLFSPGEGANNHTAPDAAAHGGASGHTGVGEVRIHPREGSGSRKAQVSSAQNESSAEAEGEQSSSAPRSNDTAAERSAI